MCLFLNGKALAIGLDDEYHINYPGVSDDSFSNLKFWI